MSKGHERSLESTDDILKQVLRPPLRSARRLPVACCEVPLILQRLCHPRTPKKVDPSSTGCCRGPCWVLDRPHRNARSVEWKDADLRCWAACPGLLLLVLN